MSNKLFYRREKPLIKGVYRANINWVGPPGLEPGTYALWGLMENSISRGESPFFVGCIPLFCFPQIDGKSTSILLNCMFAYFSVIVTDWWPSSLDTWYISPVSNHLITAKVSLKLWNFNSGLPISLIACLKILPNLWP